MLPPRIRLRDGWIRSTGLAPALSRATSGRLDFFDFDRHESFGDEETRDVCLTLYQLSYSPRRGDRTRTGDLGVLCSPSRIRRSLRAGIAPAPPGFHPGALLLELPKQEGRPCGRPRPAAVDAGVFRGPSRALLTMDFVFGFQGTPAIGGGLPVHEAQVGASYPDCFGQLLRLFMSQQFHY